MKKRVCIIVLTVLLAFGLLSLDWNEVSAQSKEDLEKEIKELEKDIESNKEKQKELQDNKSETEIKIKENEQRQESVQSQIDSIDQQLAATKSSIQVKQNEIDATNNEIENLNAQIDELAAEIERLEEEIDILLEQIVSRELLLAERLRSIQKNGGAMRYLEVLLGSKSFSDFITRAAAVNIMMDQDKTILESLATDKKEVESKKNSVGENKKNIEAKRSDVENKKIALESQKGELVALESQLDQQMAERQRLLAQLEKEHEQLEEYKFTLEDEQALLRKQEQAIAKAKQVAENNLSQFSSDTSVSSSNFIWPASGSRSSNYGYRVDPITYQRSYHLGIDIAAPTGTPVYASTNGVAVRGNLSSTYGNHILVVTKIDGVDYTTLYAHLSGFAVGDGEVVKQGQVIGYIGSTGRSTGPHLHFEVHRGGWKGFYPPNSNNVNPLNYLP
ncbi:murein hydrolase activator EnvC family protein [Ornithinibacillus halotolerans]|uniref:Peptidase M24 n=1 Tax=Ornithinibacillus halotolerans TaxID=1274357 RepID=A0A916W4K8_9BACI|nr:peptidoglycan DD-metalloendopeptidase family protein [Ornithinibacillus halotolerans]GGA67273.1 peptidase M24 [Ornithinibacillus halotolerans]